NGAAIAGATGAALTLTNLQASDAAAYTVVATDTAGSAASSVAQLTVSVSVAPTITTQPVSQFGGRTGSASFSVAASGAPAPGYQWKKNGSDIPGATNSTLSLSNLTTADAANYSVVVANVAGSVTSSTVSLTVFDQLPYAPAFT